MARVGWVLAAGAVMALGVAVVGDARGPLPAARAGEVTGPKDPAAWAVIDAAGATVATTVQVQASMRSPVIDPGRLRAALDQALLQMPEQEPPLPWLDLTRVLARTALDAPGVVRPGPAVEHTSSSRTNCAGWFITPDGYLLTAATCVTDAAQGSTATSVDALAGPVARELRAALPSASPDAAGDAALRLVAQDWISAHARFTVRATARVAVGRDRPVSGSGSDSGHEVGARRSLPARVVAVDTMQDGDPAWSPATGHTPPKLPDAWAPTGTPTPTGTPPPTGTPTPTGRPDPGTGWAAYTSATGAALLQAQVPQISALPPRGTAFPSGGLTYVVDPGAASPADSGAPPVRVLELGEMENDGSRWRGDVEEAQDDVLVPGTPVTDQRGQPIGLVVKEPDGDRRIIGGAVLPSLLGAAHVEAATGPVTQTFATGMADFRQSYYRRAADSFRTVLRWQPDHPTAGWYLRRSTTMIDLGADETPHSPTWWAAVGAGGVAVVGSTGMLGWGVRRRRATRPPGQLPSTPDDA